jgi:hypothetical protein
VSPRRFDRRKPAAPARATRILEKTARSRRVLPAAEKLGYKRQNKKFGENWVMLMRYANQNKE